MKKFTISFLFFLCLSFNMLKILPVAAATILKEGVYTVTDLNLPLNNTYTIANSSSNNVVYIFVFDSNAVVQQSIRLKPQSIKYNLIPMESNYKIIIVGKGEVTLS